MKQSCFSIGADGKHDGIKTAYEYAGNNRCCHQSLVNSSNNPKSTPRISTCIEATCNDDNAVAAILSVQDGTFPYYRISPQPMPNLGVSPSNVSPCEAPSPLPLSPAGERRGEGGRPAQCHLAEPGEFS